MVKKIKETKNLLLIVFVVTLIPGVVFGAFGDDIKVVGEAVTSGVNEEFTGIYELSDTPGKYEHVSNLNSIVNLSGTFTVQDFSAGNQAVFENGSFEGNYTGTSTQSGETLNVHEFSASDGLVIGSNSDNEITAKLSAQLSDVGTIELIAIILAIPFLFYIIGRVKDLFPGD